MCGDVRGGGEGSSGKDGVSDVGTDYLERGGRMDAYATCGENRGWKPQVKYVMESQATF